MLRAVLRGMSSEINGERSTGDWEATGKSIAYLGPPGTYGQQVSS